MDRSNNQPNDQASDDSANDRERKEQWPQWPQRPPTRPGGLDPSGPERARSGARPPGEPGSVAPWTATPTYDTQDPADPNVTRELPQVDRFGARRPSQPPPAPAPRSAQQPPAYAPRTAPQSRGPANPPTPREPQPRLDETRIAAAGELPYGGMRSPHDQETLQYTPAQRPQPRPAPQYQNPRSDSRNRHVQYEEGAELDPNVDPRHIMKQARGARRKRRYGWLLWSLVGLFAVIILAGVAFTLAWQGQYAGKIYAGVRVLDTGLGGRTPDEARTMIREKITAFAEQPVTLLWSGKEWRPRADQIGLKIDIDATVDEALSVGRGSDFIGGISQQWFAAQAGYVVPLQVQLNEPALQEYLNNTIAPEIDQAIFEGDVRLDGTRVVALPGKEGRQLLTYESITNVREQLVKLEPGQVGLTVETIQPVVSASEVRGIEEQLAVRVSAPITATAHGKTFSLDPGALVRFTTIERNPDRTAERHLSLGWKDSELQSLAEGWASDAKRPPQDARFAWRDNAVVVLTESIDGFETDPDTVLASIKQQSATLDARVYDLPGKVIAPTVSSKDLGQIGISEKLGTGTSTFKGSSVERATNIRVSANLLNGSVVAPGGTFSFLGAMGGIDEAHGFVEGYVIAAERTQLGVGGGVCQVSTTAFRAAFWSGLDITERHQHSYRVSWYEANGEPVGFDAAVFDPGVDLKWVNNTPGYILVEAVTGADFVTVNIYATKIASDVKLEGPQISNRVSAPPDVYEVDPRLPPGTKKQVETARGGLDTTITRRMTLANGEERVDQFRSSYKAWPNWFVVASPSQIPGNRPAPTP